MSKVKVAAAFGLSALALTACSRINENEVAMKTRNGRVVETITEPKVVCWTPCLMGTEFIRYKTFTDTFTISSGQGANTGGERQPDAAQSRQIFLRSSDDKLIESISLNISYKVVETENIKKLYTVFRADRRNSEENSPLLQDDLQILITEPLVRTIRSKPALSIQDQGALIGDELTRALQSEVDKRLGIKAGEVSPIRIENVVIAGVGFDQSTEAALRQRSTSEAEGLASQINAAAEQTKITGAIVRQLREDGVPADQLSEVTCLELKRRRMVSDNTSCFGLH